MDARAAVATQRREKGDQIEVHQEEIPGIPIDLRRGGVAEMGEIKEVLILVEEDKVGKVPVAGMGVAQEVEGHRATKAGIEEIQAEEVEGIAAAPAEEIDDEAQKVYEHRAFDTRAFIS